MADIKKKTGEKRVTSILNKKDKVYTKYKSLEGLKQKLEEKGLDSSKVEERFGGDRGKSKPRVMKKLLGIDSKTMNIEKPTRGNHDVDSGHEDEDHVLRKRHKSIIREMSRNRSLSTRPELTVMEKVEHYLTISQLTKLREDSIRPLVLKESSVQVTTRSTI